MKHNCRCRKCEARKTLARHPDQYHPGRVPKCSCGARAWRVDWYRMKVEKSPSHTCHCDGWWFPHRIGSLHCRYDERDVYTADVLESHYQRI